LQKEDLEEWIDNSLLLPTNQRTQMLLMVLLKEVMDTKTEVRLMPLLMLTLTSMVITSSSRVTIMLGAQLNRMLAIVATLVEIKEMSPKVKTQVEQPPEVVQIISNLLRIMEELINTSNLQVRMHSIMEQLVLNKLKNLLQIPMPQQLPITNNILKQELMTSTMLNKPKSSTMEELDKQHLSKRPVQVKRQSILRNRPSSLPSSNNSGKTTTSSSMLINSITTVNKRELRLMTHKQVHRIKVLTKANKSLSRNEEGKNQYSVSMKLTPLSLTFNAKLFYGLHETTESGSSDEVGRHMC